MLSAPRTDAGEIIGGMCAVCEDEFEDGDRIVQLAEFDVERDGRFDYTMVPALDSDHPEVHKECFSEVE